MALGIAAAQNTLELYDLGYLKNSKSIIEMGRQIDRKIVFLGRSLSKYVEAGERINRLPNTISLHRKKQTNTLYTINALNNLVQLLNDGEIDPTFPIEWENYRNMLLVTNDSGYGLKKIKTKVDKIVKL